jgi:tetratricopeptide (TPR) repeat protein
MDEIRLLLENLLKGNTSDPIGYSIYGYDFNGSRIYDVYLPTKALDNYYFMFYKNGILYDSNSTLIDLSNYKYSRIPTQKLVEMNFKKFIIYDEFCIAEHNRLNYRDYQNPTENDSNEYLNIAYEAFQSEDYDKAFDNYSRAIYEKPYDPSLYRARSSVFEKRKQISLAIDDICRGGIANPISNQNVFTYSFEGLATVYKNNGNFEAAVKCYTAAIENNGGQSWNIKGRAKCFSELGFHNKAVGDIKSLIADKKSIDLSFDLGEIYLKASLISEAKEAFKEVVNFIPDTDNEMYKKVLDDMNRPIKELAVLHLQKLK